MLKSLGEREGGKGEEKEKGKGQEDKTWRRGERKGQTEKLTLFLA